MNHHFVEIGLSLALVAIIASHLTSAAPSPYVESDMTNSLSKYKQQLSNALRERGGDEATNRVLTANARHFLTSALHKKRTGQKRRDMDLSGTDDDASKRRGAWYYDYGLGGGRFGKRYYDDYGLGGGRFGRDVDHVDLLDA